VENGVDLSAYHEANRRKYLGALFLYQILGAAANLIISSLSAAVWLVIAGLAGVAAAWLWRDRRVQLAALAIYVAMTAWYASQYVAVL
jgi:hypothetical protein